MDFRAPDTAIRALATKDTRKRPGHKHPTGFTGGIRARGGIPAR